MDDAEHRLCVIAFDGHAAVDNFVALTLEDVFDVLDEQRALPHRWVWLAMQGPVEELANPLADYFNLDRITRDDLLEPQGPKFDDLEVTRTVSVHALAQSTEKLRTVEVDIIIGADYVLSIQSAPVSSIDYVLGRAEHAQFLAESPFHLAARLIEYVGEQFLPVLDLLDNQVLNLEDGAVEGDPAVLHEVHALRRDVAVLRRVIGPQRRMLEVLATRSFARTGKAQRDLADAIDHHVLLIDSLDAAHSLISDLIDTYRSAAAERMNEVMKTLTVFTAIFMPMTLITGIYGMNFDRMPELGQPWGYFGALMLMAIVAGGLWMYFVRRGFIGGVRVRDLATTARAAGRIGKGLAEAATIPIRAPSRIITETVRRPRLKPDLE